MNYKIISALTLVLALASCKQELKEKDQRTTEPSPIEWSDKKPAVSEELIYQYSKNNDELVLKLLREGDSVRGTLIYNLSEKDKNTGTVVGVFKGNLLIAEYEFMSEGVVSTRQLVFKVDDRALLEGFGDIEERDGKVIFKDVNKLQYNPELKLELVPEFFAN